MIVRHRDFEGYWSMILWMQHFSVLPWRRHDPGEDWTHPNFTLQILHVKVWRTDRLCQPAGWSNPLMRHPSAWIICSVKSEWVQSSPGSWRLLGRTEKCSTLKIKFWWDDNDISRLWRILKYDFEGWTFSVPRRRRHDPGGDWTNSSLTLQKLYVKVWRNNRLCQPASCCVTLRHKVSLA